jgi:hypothetical protein
MTGETIKTLAEYIAKLHAGQCQPRTSRAIC